MELNYFSFQAWKVMDFNCRSWKVMENYGYVWYVNYCRSGSMQGQNIMQTSYVRKYPKSKDDFDNFRNWQLNFRSWKTEKSHGI